MTPRPWLAVLLTAAVLAGCGGGGPDDPTDAPASTSAPDTTASVDGGLPRVVLGGDSVMENLADGVIAGLGDQVSATYLAQARISGDAAATQAWVAMVEEEKPDLIVIHVGSWEVLSPAFHPGEPAWYEEYASEVLDPFVETLTADGAEVLFIGPAAARDERRTVSLISLNRQLVELPARHPEVDFLNAGTYLNGPTGGFTETLPGPGGQPVRIRRTDDLGLHLCPAGVVRLGTPVIQWIDDHLDQEVTPVEGWDRADWTRPPALDKPEQCPPV